MKLAVRLVVIVAVVGVTLLGLSRYREARLDRELTRLQTAESPAEAYVGALEFLGSHPNLDEERLDEAVGVLTNSAFESGDIDGLVSALDSLRAVPMSDRVAHRLSAELHDALVMRTMMAPTEGDVERADGIARGLLSAVDLPAGSYTMMASLRSGLLADAPKSSSHWLTLELAWRGFGLTESPTRAYETAALDSAVEALLNHAAGKSGVEKALAVADSVSAALRDPTLRAVLNANRYRLTAETSPERARAYAGALLDSPGAISDWRILNEIGVDIRNRELDFDLALNLCEWALSVAATSADSQTIFSSIGWIHHKTGDDAEATRYLQASVERLVAAPSLDDSAVRRLLDVYEASGAYGAGIELLATVVARSVLPNEDARERLGKFLALAGREADEIPELVAAHRYAGVTQAPEFEAVDASGAPMALSGLRGNVVVLCFWSYG